MYQTIEVEMSWYRCPQLLIIFLLYYGDGENGLFLHRRKTENCAENKEVDELIL